jgi:hypothetical protein
MFHLVIDHHTDDNCSTAHTSAHPSREIALQHLLTYLDDTGHDYRVTRAHWTHSTYQILSRTANSEPILTPRGTAVIAEICQCHHTEEEHDDNGCTAAQFDGTLIDYCDCPHYATIPGDPTLFDLPAVERRPRTAS